MKLNDILKGLEVLSATADMAQEITGVSYDSRTTAPGSVFVAISGEAVDGHRFIPIAAEKGAVCVVCERVPERDIPYVQVKSSRKALALMAANWFDHPAREMTMIGVTGTSGKTTSTYLIKSILEQKAGAKVGLVGTIQNMIGDQVLHTERTTPESFELQKLFRQMSDAGCTHVVMEVSSHALALDRVYGIRFAVGIFTNLSQDHLDFHHTMEEYCDAKAILFDRCDVAIYNADDPWHQRMLAHCSCRTFSYSAKGEADLSAKSIQLHAGSVDYDAEADTEWAHVHVGIPAIFTVYNTLDAIAACWNLGVPIAECADALAKNHGVKGRMEIIPTPGKNFTILNDYAHKPDALENVLSSVRGFAKGRTVVVFGCGGDRDRTKRPEMAQIAVRYADTAVFTSDNPRHESPEAILDQMAAGLEPGARFLRIADRAEAIRTAVMLSQPGDILLVAGKGHETYQIVGDVKHPFDDREEVRKAFDSFGK